MQRPSLSRANQPLKRGATIRLAVIGQRNNSNNPNSRSSSDPSRADEVLTQGIKIQNFTTKPEERPDIVPTITKTKSSNQVGEAEFSLVPALTESPFKNKTQIIDNFPSKAGSIDQAELRSRMKSQNDKRILIGKTEHKQNFLMPHLDNNSRGDRLKSYKFLRPLGDAKNTEDYYVKNRQTRKEQATPALPEQVRQSFQLEGNLSPEPSIKLEDKTNEVAHPHEVSYTANDTGIDFHSSHNHSQELFHRTIGAGGDSELSEVFKRSIHKGAESPLLVISQLDIQGTKINTQLLPNNASFSPKRTTKIKNFRIQNTSPQKQRLRPPTSPFAVPQSKQHQHSLSPQKTDTHYNPEPKATQGSSGMWMTHTTSASANESYLNSLNIKNKKEMSPPKTRKDWRNNVCADVTKINEIKQQVLNLDWSNSHVMDKMNDNMFDNDNMSQDIEDEEDEDSNSQMSGSLNKKVLLLESVYSGRQPTVFFQYPSCCQQVRDATRTHPISPEDEKIYDFKYKAPLLMCVKRTFETAGFKLTDEAGWNVIWAQPKYDRVKDMNKYQKTNHFPGCWEVGRKDGLWRNLSKMKRQFPMEYNFIPNTYLLSTDYDRFVQIKEAADNKAIWIMKPCASACGRGIKIISKSTKLPKNPNYLVSEYIANPHLIDGLKYDLRVYVLVSSYDPLRIYLFKEGLVRFATEKYSTKKKNLKQKFAHLTNWSVNKHSEKFVKNEKADQDGQGSKWSFSALRKKFEEMNISYDGIMEKIKDIITKTLISAEPLMLSSFNRTQEHRNNCFELYGFDVLIDSNLKPWLMEVNVCASLNSSSPLDRKIKTSLICDIMNLVGVQPFNKKKIEEEAKNKLYGFENRKLFAKTYYELFDLDETNCVEKLSADDWNVLFETDEELHRKGGFERIFPQRENISTYAKFFEYQRYNNILVWQWMKAKTNFLEKISKKISDVAV